MMLSETTHTPFFFQSYSELTAYTCCAKHTFREDTLERQLRKLLTWSPFTSTHGCPPIWLYWPTWVSHLWHLCRALWWWSIPTKPSSWYAITHFVLTALPNFPKGNKSYQVLFSVLTVALIHSFQKMGSMVYRLTSTLLVFRRSLKTLNQPELQHTTRAVMDITCSLNPTFAWHVE